MNMNTNHNNIKRGLQNFLCAPSPRRTWLTASEAPARDAAPAEKETFKGIDSKKLALKFKQKQTSKSKSKKMIHLTR